MKSLATRFLVVILFLASAAELGAQTLRNTITFDNQSGEPALVKLVGPTTQTVDVPHGEKRTVNVAIGEYYLLARYGADSKRYSYSRGNPFKVEETTTQSSAITITLHKVVGGNYPSRSASREEFDQALIPASKTPPDQPATAAAMDKAPEKLSKGEEIISDSSLFSRDFGKAILKKASTVKSLDLSSLFLAQSVDGPTPTLASIQKKHGKPDSVKEETKSQFRLPFDATIYWYGRIGFVVAKGDADGKVTWIAFK